MTIADFYWGDFWASVWTPDWSELGMLFALAVVWRALRSAYKTSGGETFVGALFFLALAFAFGVGRKLFADLDAVVLLYAALFLVALNDFRKARAKIRRERRDADWAKRKRDAARRRAFFNGSDVDGSLRRRHSRHSSSGRSRRSGSERSSRRGASGSSEGRGESGGEGGGE